MVGHDWGASAAWHLSLFRPDRVKGMIAIGVPFLARNPDMKPTQFFKSFGDDLNISQYQVLFHTYYYDVTYGLLTKCG